MKIRTAVVALAVATASCSSSTTMRPAQQSAQHEGSVTKSGSSAEYPDGAVVRVSKVITLPGDRCYEMRAHHTCIGAQITLKNTGQQPIHFRRPYGVGHPIVLNLYDGANRYEAHDATIDGDPLARAVPQQCVPGSSVTTGAVWAVPTSRLDHLALTFAATVQGIHYTPYTFTDLQTMLDG